MSKIKSIPRGVFWYFRGENGFKKPEKRQEKD